MREGASDGSAERDELVGKNVGGKVCKVLPVRECLYYRTKRRLAEESASAGPGEAEGGGPKKKRMKYASGDTKFRCAVCPGRGRLYCVDCSTESETTTKRYVGLCAPSTGRPCLHVHMNAKANKQPHEIPHAERSGGTAWRSHDGDAGGDPARDTAQLGNTHSPNSAFVVS